MNKNIYINKWLFFPYLKDNDLDYLIHPDDLIKVTGLGVVKALEMEGGFLKVQYKKVIIRVNVEGVKRILPDPKYTWGEKVNILTKPDSKAQVEDLFWHHNNEEFLYLLKVNGKKKTKQYQEKDLMSSTYTDRNPNLPS